ncbi:MAG: hypothetical protein CYG59_05290 [Chloroflexi bacterium]|nr:MAG: hypothetical protein CYG59_05290 [Chloroflexota bacterium]
MARTAGPHSGAALENREDQAALRGSLVRREGYDIAMTVEKQLLKHACGIGMLQHALDMRTDVTTSSSPVPELSASSSASAVRASAVGLVRTSP